MQEGFLVIFVHHIITQLFMVYFRPDFEAGYHDFKVRLENYEKVDPWT